MKNRLLLLLTALLILIGGATFAYRALSDHAIPEISPHISNTDTREDFQAEDQNGNPVQFRDFLGEQPTVVYFWTTWCNFCKAGLDILKYLHETEGDRVQFLGVNASQLGLVRGEAEAGRTFWLEQNFPFPSLYDTNAEAIQAYDVTAIPLALFFDSTGALVSRQLGFQSAESMSAIMARLY